MIDPHQIEVISEVQLEVSYQFAWFAKPLFKASSFSPAKQTSLRLSTLQPGMHEISGTDLSTIPCGTSDSQVKVYYGSEQIARQVTSSGGCISKIRFVVPDFSVTLYDRHATLWISWDSGSGIDPTTTDGDPTLLSATDSVYNETIEFANSTTKLWRSWPITNGTTAKGDPIMPGENGYFYNNPLLPPW